MSRRLARALLAALVLASACQTDTGLPRRSPSTPAAGAASPRPVAADLAVSADLRAAVEPEAILEHLDELFAIAQAHEGIRAAGTPGYDASVAYSADLLREAGYRVTVDEFEFPYFNEVRPAVLDLGSGNILAGGENLRPLIFSASGDITAPVATVAIDEAGGRTGSAGCEADDWEDFPDGAIAVTGPGGCFTRQKVDRAITARAAALIVANPGWPAGEVRRPTLLYPEGIDIPAVGASAEVGEALRAAAEAGASVHLEVETLIEQRPTANILAERTGDSQPDEVVMMGGHLDSVIDGPGINDNGSGTMTILEIALRLAELPATRRTVRFAFWSGEELGLYGSHHYVDVLSDEERDRIVAYLNFDMVASPNYGRLVYDPAGAVAESRDITAAFGAYLDAVGLTYELDDLGGGSDHGPFMDALIPVGGLFSGASELKTDEQAALFGGDAGEPMSPCFHLACDTTDEINPTALDEMSDAAAHVLMVLLAGP